MTRADLDARTGKPRTQRRLSVRFGTDAKMCGGLVLDISDGGIRVDSPESFPVNSLITVFVQFPRHSVRLRARVIWCSAAGGAANMGLALTQPEPALKRAFVDWLAEARMAEAGTAPPEAARNQPTASPGPAEAAAPAAPAPPAPEPQGPITRRLEGRQGQSYEALLERRPQGWNLTIVQLPRQLGVGAPDFVGLCSDYASAERALREFVRTH